MRAHKSCAAPHFCVGGLLLPCLRTFASAALPDVPQPLPCGQQSSCIKIWTTQYTLHQPNAALPRSTAGAGHELGCPAGAMQTVYHIAERRHCLTFHENRGHHAVLLQAEVDSWPSSHAATPGAVLLAVPGPGLPGAPSRQGCGMAEEQDAICSDVSLEVEGTTRQVRCPRSSGASKHDAASMMPPTKLPPPNTSKLEDTSSCAKAPCQSSIRLPAQPHCWPWCSAGSCYAVWRVNPTRMSFTGMLVKLSSGSKVASGVCILLSCCAGSWAGSC